MMIFWIVLVSILMMAGFVAVTVAGNRAQGRQIRDENRKDAGAPRP